MALLLMALIVFIHAVKALHHHHDNPIQNKVQANRSATALDYSGYPATISAKNNCAICDFHFFKDSDDYTTFFTIEALNLYSQFNATIVKNFFFTTPGAILLRGPPALV